MIKIINNELLLTSSTDTYKDTPYHYHIKLLECYIFRSGSRNIIYINNSHLKYI